MQRCRRAVSRIAGIVDAGPVAFPNFRLPAETFRRTPEALDGHWARGNERRLPWGLRGFASSSETPGNEALAASRLFRNARASSALAAVAADGREAISLAEFHALCRVAISAESAAADDTAARAAPDAAAAEVAEALQTSGAVLTWRDTVYLRPSAVLAALDAALPAASTHVDTAARQLDEIGGELAALEAQKAALDRGASASAGRALWGGLVLLTGQTVLFFRLTFWDLSWDVIEPLSYFVGMSFVIGGYLYFLATKSDFTYEGFHAKLAKRAALRSYKAAQFDAERHAALAQVASRARAVLARVAK